MQSHESVGARAAFALTTLRVVLVIAQHLYRAGAVHRIDQRRHDIGGDVEMSTMALSPVDYGGPMSRTGLLGIWQATQSS